MLEIKINFTKEHLDSVKDTFVYIVEERADEKNPDKDLIEGFEARTDKEFEKDFTSLHGFGSITRKDNELTIKVNDSFVNKGCRFMKKYGWKMYQLINELVRHFSSTSSIARNFFKDLCRYKSEAEEKKAAIEKNVKNDIENIEVDFDSMKSERKEK